MGKSIIAPVIGVIFIAVKLITGVDFGSDVEAQVTEWVTTGAAIAAVVYGIWKNHRKSVDKPPEN